MVRFKQSSKHQIVNQLKLWVPFSVIGIVMICLWISGAENVYMMLVSRQWPSVTGSIIQSQIERSSGSYRSTAPSKTAVIVYRYKVNGSSFTSNRVLWGNETYYAGLSEPGELIRRYPIGKAVSVYYDPENPALGVLEKRARTLDYGFIGFSSSILFLQIYFLVYLWKKKRNKH